MVLGAGPTSSLLRQHGFFALLFTERHGNTARSGEGLGPAAHLLGRQRALIKTLICRAEATGMA